MDYTLTPAETEIHLACEKAGNTAKESVYAFYRNSYAHRMGYASNGAANWEAEQAYDRAYYEKEEELTN